MPFLTLCRRITRRWVAVTATVAFTCAAPLAAAPALADTGQDRIDLRILVVTDGAAGVDTIVAQLDREGLPYDTIDLTATDRPKITAATLSDGASRAKYQGVVMPNENALPADELAVLADFERRFGIRQIDAYTWTGPGVGLSNVWGGTLDGTPLTITPAARSSGFGYLADTLTIDDHDPAVSETYGYLGAPIDPATFTPLVTATRNGATGSLLGVYTHGGREELVVSLAANRYQTHAMVLAHGLVTWLTRGIHLGYWRNWLSVHVDDVLLPDARWHMDANCTVGDGCPPDVTAPDIRMTPDDVAALTAWQDRQGIKLDLAFNAGGSADAGADDPLTAKLLADKGSFRWINHTYSHPYLGCVQDFSKVPWQCATDPATGQTRWVSYQEIATQILNNVSWARARGISLNPGEVVTGEHSGLRTLPQMSDDNPNLVPALQVAGVRVIASDASREAGPRQVGPARTVPRHPMNIFYNVATKAEEIDEYNWIYNSRADGGSGICENNPSSTCIPPLPGVAGFTDHIVPLEARIAFDHVVSADPAPHYAHQSNLAEDRILYPVLDAVLARYRATFSTATPLVNPRFTDVATQSRRQEAWQAAVRAGTIEAFQQNGRVTIVNHGAGSIDAPVTAPTGTRNVAIASGTETDNGVYGEAYGSQRSAWTSLSPGAQMLLRLPS